MEKPSRIFKYDNLKFVLIALVVIGHMADYYPGWDKVTTYTLTRQYIYAFHMPLFIFVSGLFYKNKNVAQKVFSFLFCALGMTAVNTLIKIVFKRKAAPDILNVRGIEWYLYAMAFFYIGMYLLREINPKLLLSFSFLVSFLIGYTNEINHFLALTRVIVFFPFFILGTIINRDKLVELTKKKWLKPVGALVLIGWAVFMIITRDNIGKLTSVFYCAGKAAYRLLPDILIPYGVPLRILWYLFSAALGFALICLIPDKKLPAVSTFGSRTLQVYFWHTPIIFALVYSGIAAKMTNTFTGQLIYLSLGMIIVLVLSLKPFAFPTSQIMKYSKRRD